MELEIRRATLGMVQTNAYIVGDKDTGDAVLIDPVDDAQALYDAVQEAGWTIKLILATHAHFDHVLASKEFKALTNAPFWIHEDCVEQLKQLPETGKRFGLGDLPEAAEPDKLLGSERETIQIGDLKFETLYTPGHAVGHLSFYMPEHNLVFSGDALFQGSIGRVDLPGGNYEQLMQSIFTQLIPLGDDTLVLPGHGINTTIGCEKQTNPYLLSWDGVG